MIWLHDDTGFPTSSVTDFSSLVETQKMYAHSEINLLLPLGSFRVVSEATYLSYRGRAYRIVSVTTTENPPQVEVLGYCASTELGLRTIIGTLNHTGTSGAFVAAMRATLGTGFRNITLLTGDLSPYGTSTTRQRSWGNMYEDALSIMLGDNLSLTARYRNGGIYLDAVVPALAGDISTRLAGSATIVDDIRAWANYAYVLGQGEGEDRELVEVNLQGSSDPFIELYVDADDISPDDLTLTEYRNALYDRGLEKLAEARRVQYAEATVDTSLSLGDVVWYDGAVRGYLMATEIITTQEGGQDLTTVTLGEPPLSLREKIRSV